MNIDKIKQVIRLQREIRKENDGVINISMIGDEAKVLISPKLFKKLFKNKNHTVKIDKNRSNEDIYFYSGEFEGIKPGG